MRKKCRLFVSDYITCKLNPQPQVKPSYNFYIKSTKRVVLRSKISKSKPAPATLFHSKCTTPLKTAYQDCQSALDDIEWIMVYTKTILLDIIQPV